MSAPWVRFRFKTPDTDESVQVVGEPAYSLYLRVLKGLRKSGLIQGGIRCEWPDGDGQLVKHQY